MSSDLELMKEGTNQPISPTKSSSTCKYKITETKFRLSPEDRIEYENIFDLFAGEEKNISAKEVGTVMAKLGIHCSKEELNDMIDVVDKDGYGLVHKKHFMNLMTQKVKETTLEGDRDVQKDAFELFDQKKEGKLTMSDIRSIMLNIGEKVCDCEIEEMLAAIKADTTGVTYESFLNLVSGGGN